MTQSPPVPALHSTSLGTAGPTVVFLHGLFGQGRNFTQIAKALAPRYRSLLVDLPDHGRSGWTEAVDYVAYADAVAAHLRSGPAREGAVHVVGHSMGGKVAMVLALRHPGLVDHLAVLDISPVRTGGEGEFAHLLDSLAGLDLTRVTRRADADTRLAGQIRSAQVRGFLLQNLRAGDDGTWRWQANLGLLRRDLPTIGGFPELTAEPFPGPVLWVAGARSDYVRPEHRETMQTLFPRVRAVTIKDAGHWVHSEQPEVVTSVLRGFLAPS